MSSVTLSEAKDQLRLESAFVTDDDYITFLITAAESYAEGYCNRKLITQTWEKSFENWTDVELNSLSGGQLQEVIQITWCDEDNSSSILSADSYIVSGVGTDAGRIDFVNDVDLSTDLYQVAPIKVKYTVGYYQGDDWAAENSQAVGDCVIAKYGLIAKCTVDGTTDATVPTWPATIGEIVVDGTATWEIIGEAIPNKIKHAILVLITHSYENREPGGCIEIVNNMLLPYRIWAFAE